MQEVEARSVLDDFDPYIDECERAELGESRVLVKDELYMPVHPSRDWIKCFVTSTQQDGFRMYMEGTGKRFLLSAKSFDVGKYYISAYEGFPNIDSKPKCGYVARVERQRDSSFLVCLDYCHLCDQRLGQFCCGRSRTEREVVAKISHSVKRYRKVNMEFKCISVTIPTISKSGTRKVWCPRSFRKVNPSLPNSADVYEALSATPKMGMKLVSKLPEWSEDAKNLVVRFQGSGRILVASAKNFLLYEDKYSVLDFAEQSLSHIEEPPSKGTSTNSSLNGGKVAAVTKDSGESGHKARSLLQQQHKHQHKQQQQQQAGKRGGICETTEEDDADFDIEAMGASGALKSSSVAQRVRSANESAADVPAGGTAGGTVGGTVVPNRAIDRLKSDSTVRTGTSSEAGDEASRSSSRASGGVSKEGRSSSTSTSKRSSRAEKGDRKSSRQKEGDDGSQSKRSSSSSSRRKTGTGGVGDAESLSSVSPKGTPRPPSSVRSQEGGRSPSKSDTPKDAVERSVLQFGKSTDTRFVLDFKYPLSPLQAFGIAISTFASDEIVNAGSGAHEVNHMNSPVVVSRKQMEYSRNRSASFSLLQSQASSPLKSPFLPSAPR